MSNIMQFDLASPQKLMFSKPVAMVTIPGSEGVFGVLPGHALMNAQVTAGVVEIYEADQGVVTERLFVAGGFCEVMPDRCTLLADQVTPVKKLNRADIEDEIKVLSNAAKDDEAAVAKLALAQAKLAAVAA